LPFGRGPRWRLGRGDGAGPPEQQSEQGGGGRADEQGNDGQGAVLPAGAPQGAFDDPLLHRR
jgi:hypothetical protein